MIKSIYLQNFQSHKDTTLEFSEGVNIIVGSSDSGKTAILRAIKWLTTNRPLGDAFRSNWGGETSVTLITDSDTITRSKDKAEKYHLNDTLFTAFKTEVPIEIIKALNMSEINLQQQLDAPFLLTESPGAVASHFNKVANLDKIDLAQSNIKKWTNQLTNDVANKSADIAQKEEELTTFDYLEKFEIDVEVLEEKEKQRIILSNNAYKLQVKIDDLDELTTLIEKEEEILTLESLLSKVLEKIENKEKLKDTCVDLIHFLHEIEKVEVELDMMSELLSIEDPLLEILSKYEERKILVGQQAGLYRLMRNIQIGDKELIEAEDRYDKLHTKFADEFPDICPLCGEKQK